MGTPPKVTQPDPDSKALEELKAIRRAVESLADSVDAFARAFLDAKFPYGKPDDRWRARG